MAVRMFGIANCDTIKRAKTWLSEHGIAYDFQDYKKSGVDATALRGWVSELGWEVLLNKAGTTFRALSDAEKQDLGTEKAIRLMLAYPSMIKRPVLHHGNSLIVGFKPELYEKAFGCG
ncbi:arsenate reductase [Sandarakinorhabdus sp.]|uniref:arsenate reductase n=1 Tax=Sandarakinorhabdus sp. TaxID=1916663 RepID=UPI00333E5ECD